MKNRTLKAILSVILLASIIIPFAACSKKDDEENNAEETIEWVADWAVEPTISAQAIDPIVRADFNENTNHYDISYDSYFRIMVNSKYGIIDSNGKIVLEAKYDDLYAIRNSDDYLGIIKNSDGSTTQKYIHNDTFTTETAYKKYNSEKYEYYWNTRDRELVFVKTESGDSKKQSGVPTLPEVVKGVVYSGNKYNADGTYGLYYNSEMITNLIYSNAGCFSDGKVAFESNGKWGYIDSTGRTVIPFEYESVLDYNALGGSDTPYESFGGYVTLCKDKKFGVLDDNGEIAVPFNYDDATPVVNGKLYVKENNKWGVLIVDKNAVSTDTTVKTEDKTTTTTENETTIEATSQAEQDATTTTEAVEAQYTTGLYKVRGDLRVRDNPELGDNVVSGVSDGDSVRVDSVEGNWGHISYDGAEGWICLDYADRIEEE